jgi:hypothetical protein
MRVGVVVEVQETPNDYNYVSYPGDATLVSLVRANNARGYRVNGASPQF